MSMLGKAKRGVVRVLQATLTAINLLGENGIGLAARWFWADLRGQRRVFRVSIAGTPLLVRSASPDLGTAWASFQSEFRGLSGLALKGPGCIVDAGGHIGTAAIALARMFPDRKIVTVEPSSENYALLCENVAAMPNIRPVRAALGAETGRRRLRDRGTGEVGFTIVEGAGSDRDGTAEEVPVLSMPALMEAEGIADIAILKLDIEGAERELLAGRPDWIARCEVILAELHDRIAPGATRAYVEATATGREDLPSPGEKLISRRL